MSGIFITGTNTGVGKTIVCGHLTRYLHECGLDVITQKWVQTGCNDKPEDLLVHDDIIPDRTGYPPDDLLRLRCPYIFSLPASPHLAAAEENTEINPNMIVDAYRYLEAEHDLVVVEGAGGLNVPLTTDLLIGDLAGQLSLKTVVVVENTLGCVNHSLLTVEALRERDIPIVGLVFNRIRDEGDEVVLNDNPRIIHRMTGVPILGELPVLERATAYSSQFRRIGQNFQREYGKGKENE